VVLGERLRERLLEEGISSDRIRIIHNWADGDTIKPIELPSQYSLSSALSGAPELEPLHSDTVPEGDVLGLIWNGCIGNSLQKERGLEGKFVAGYSGNLGRAHEFETVLEAAQRFKDEPEIRKCLF